MAKSKFVRILLVIVCLLLFTGCANIEYQRITDDTGRIIDKIVIEIDESEILERMSKEKLAALKEDINNDIKSYVQSVKQAKQTLKENNTDTSLDYDNGIVIENTGWTLVEGSTYRIMVQMIFENSTYLNKLYGSDNDKESDTEAPTEIVSGLFISKYVMYSDNVFSNMEEATSADNKNYFDYYSDSYGEFGVKDITLSQMYGTTDTRLKSNADYVENIDGINYHLWEIDTENAGYKTMKLSYYYRTAVGTGWYIVALGLSVGLAILLIMVYIIKVRKDRRYKRKVELETRIVNELEKDE